MPNLAILPTQSLVSPADTAGGNGGRGVNEIVGGALSALGQGAHLYEQHQDEKARVWAGAAASDLHVKQLRAVQDQRQAAVDAVAGGQPVPDMTGAFLQGFDKDAGAVIASAPNGRAKAYLQEQLTRARTSLGDHMLGQQAQLEREWKLSTADTTMTNGAKVVQQDPSQFNAQMGNVIATMPHIDPATDHAHALKAQGTLANAAATSVLDNNPDGLKADTGKAMGEGGFKGPTGVGYIDAATPEQIHTWNNLATAKINQRNNSAITAQNARETAAAAEHNKLSDLVNSGQAPSLDYVNQVRAATVGTSVADDTNRLITLGTKSAGFGSQSLPAQARALAALDAQATAKGTDPESVAARAQLETIHTTQLAAYKDNPLDAASRFAHVAVLPVQEISSPTQALQVVSQRIASLPSVEAASGSPASPLQPAEAAQLTKILQQLPTDQQATFLTSLGKAVGTQPRIAAVAKQLGDHDGTLGLAMAYAGAPGYGAPTNAAGQQVAQLILDGDRALKQRTSAEDSSKQTGWKATIAGALKGVYPNPQLEDAAIDAATKIAAARSANGQGDDLDIAVKLATGGVIEHGTAGGKIPLPYGMQSSSDFEKKVAAITPDTLAAQAPQSMVMAGRSMIPLETFVKSLPDATFVHAGQGLYTVRAGSSFVTSTDGKPITLKITP